MSIHEMQRAFVNVLTDAEAQSAYLTDPAAFLATYALDERESRALTGVDLSRLKIYSRMLLQSRLELGLKAFPHAKNLLPPDFMKRYGPRYGKEFPRTVEHDAGPLSREFRRLVPFFERLVAEGEIVAENFLDVMHYDAIRYRLANDPIVYEGIAEFERLALPLESEAILTGPAMRSPGVEVRAFTHPVIGAAADAAAAPAGKTASPALLLFHKRSVSRHVRVFRISASTNQFLRCCDGRRALPEAARLAALSLGGDSTLDNCVQLGLTLVGQGVLGVMPDASGAR